MSLFSKVEFNKLTQLFADVKKLIASAPAETVNYIKLVLAQFDLSLTDLRDAITGAGGSTLDDVVAAVVAPITGTIDQGSPAIPANAWPTSIIVGGAAIDPRAIRALVNTDVVGVVDAAGNRQPAGDAVGRRIYITPTDGTNTMPTGDAAARRIYQQLTDGTDNLDIVKAGDSYANGICAHTEFIADPAAVATTKIQAMLCDRNGMPLAIPPDYHYCVQGRSFGACSPVGGLAIGAGTAVDVGLISNSNTRLNYTNEIRVDVTGDPCLIEISRVPTVKAVGTGITAGNRYTASGTAATATVYYSPTITAQGTVVYQGIVDDGVVFQWKTGALDCLDWNAGRFLIRATGLNPLGTGSTLWFSVEWAEILV